jgi:hypothetical protein
MPSRIATSFAAVAFAGAVVLGSSPASAQHWHHHHGGGVAAGIIGGLAAGAIIGGALAARPYPVYEEPVYGPPPADYDDWVAYCSSRYRSFDPASGTYMGYDGVRHPCR